MIIAPRPALPWCDEFGDEYYEACGSWWEDYDPQVHAGMADDPDEE